YIDTAVDTSPTASRGWYWMICNEFGYWQTSPRDSRTPLRSRLITLQSDLDSCPYVFPGGPNKGQVDTLNLKHLGQTGVINRLLYVNGELDPWRRLSVSAPDSIFPTADQSLTPRYVIPGGSHCKDLGFAQ
ncbi:peptidase S28, partial [Piptocephalis cylindrospora]